MTNNKYELVQRVQQQRRSDRPIVITTNKIGSTKNNSDRPYHKSRYTRQRTIMLSKKEYYTRTFLEEAIQNHRVVIFAKNKSHPICKKVESFFIANVCGNNNNNNNNIINNSTKKILKSEMIVYHWDELPYQGGQQMQKHLMENYDSTTTQNCYVFIRGTHVPLTKMETILISEFVTVATATLQQPSYDGSHCSNNSSSSSSSSSTHGGYDNSSWFYPETD
ncbi:MAG: hypothetical protein ACI90V_012093 [Bacillariaceae sp.]|jgi:hypothetical protein